MTASPPSAHPKGTGPRRAGIAAWLEEHPPPGPFRPEFWRSPLRGPWLTSVLGLVLLFGIPIVAITGLISYAAYDPRLPGNETTPERDCSASTSSTGRRTRYGCTGSRKGCTSSWD